MPNYLEVLSGPNRPKIGVVLSSGGIRPFAALELFAFFEQAQIPIDLLVGCSGGGIAAVMKAMGFSVEEMREAVKKFINPELFQIDPKTVSALLHLPFSQFSKEHSLLKGGNSKKTVDKLVGERRLEDLLIPTVLQTTDLETGESVVLTKGNLADALYASTAIVPFFPPILVEKRWLVDGVYSASLPILEAVSRGVDIIIAMDFSAGIQFKPTNFLEYFNDFTNHFNKNTVHLQNSLAVDTHHYEIIFMEVNFGAPVPMWEVGAIPSIYKHGNEAVEAAKQDIINAIEMFPDFLKNVANPS